MNMDNLKPQFFNQNKKYLSLLLLIGIISYLVRSYYFEPEVFLAFDSLGYFFYAADITVLGHLPENYTLANNFWPIFLSLFFSLFQFENTIQYMDLQKNLAMILSTITIIPIYFLARKFVEPKYSIVATIIFTFEPRLIQNSMLGITESFYILLGTLTLLFFLSSKKKLVYLSFVFAALATITRGEGQILFFVISIMFFIRFRKEKLVIPNYLMALGIFVLILAPMMSYQMEIQETDSVFGRAVTTISYHAQDSNETNGESGLPFFITGIENFSKFFVWALIPIFIFFVPIGIFYLFKNPDFKKLTLILGGIGLSIPAFYAYSIPLLDTRYLFMIYPIFCIISVFTAKKFSSHFKKENIIISLIIIGVISSSIIFLELKSDENFQKFEASQIAKEIIKEPKIMNSFYPEDHYLESAFLPEKWRDFEDLFLGKRIDGSYIRHSISSPITTISTEGYFSIEDFINENKELTHIYVDGGKERSKFIVDIFENENQYKFLIKEYDSKELGFDYHVKIFRIIK
jgi:hypothetical protein